MPRPSGNSHPRRALAPVGSAYRHEIMVQVLQQHLESAACKLTVLRSQPDPSKGRDFSLATADSLLMPTSHWLGLSYWSQREAQGVWVEQSKSLEMKSLSSLIEGWHFKVISKCGKPHVQLRKRIVTFPS